MAENQRFPSPFLGYKERRKSIGCVPYTLLGLVLQLEDILEIVIRVHYLASLFTKGCFGTDAKGFHIQIDFV